MKKAIERVCRTCGITFIGKTWACGYKCYREHSLTGRTAQNAKPRKDQLAYAKPRSYASISKPRKIYHNGGHSGTVDHFVSLTGLPHETCQQRLMRGLDVFAPYAANNARTSSGREVADRERIMREFRGAERYARLYAAWCGS